MFLGFWISIKYYTFAFTHQTQLYETLRTGDSFMSSKTTLFSVAPQININIGERESAAAIRVVMVNPLEYKVLRYCKHQRVST